MPNTIILHNKINITMIPISIIKCKWALTLTKWIKCSSNRIILQCQPTNNLKVIFKWRRPIGQKKEGESAAFIPKGTFNATTFDAGLDDLDDVGKGKGKGKKKQQKVRPVVKEETPAEDDVNLTPYKGKPSSFFVMEQDLSNVTEHNPNGYNLNNEQWSFVFLHYPEYA